MCSILKKKSFASTFKITCLNFSAVVKHRNYSNTAVPNYPTTPNTKVSNFIDYSSIDCLLIMMAHDYHKQELKYTRFKTHEFIYAPLSRIYARKLHLLENLSSILRTAQNNIRFVQTEIKSFRFFSILYEIVSVRK